MHVPRAWAKASGTATSPEGAAFPLRVWGCGADAAAAQADAEERLARVAARIAAGDDFPDAYDYDAARPLREEEVERFEGDDPEAPEAIVTRNRYGALVLNARRLLILDVDAQPPSLGARLRGLFGGRRGDDPELLRLRAALGAFRGASFRIYRTAAGYRAIAMDRLFDPASDETRALMEATGTDPAYRMLSARQRCFRARLTPKPWRCGCDGPPGRHPRDDAEARAFTAWCGAYDRASAAHAVCSIVEEIGRGRPAGVLAPLIARHDAATRCDATLPLA